MLPNEKCRKGDSAQAYFKINRPQIGLFFLRKSIGFHFLVTSHFDSPLPSIFNSTFQKYFSWKFLSDFIRILDFIFSRVKHFESPLGTDFSLKIPFQKILEFQPDFVTISQFVHILFGTISDDQGAAVVFGGTHTRRILRAHAVI